MYIANTGFGYGDSDVGRALRAAALALRQEPPLGRRTPSARNGPQTLQQYFATAGAYDVYDEKVMEETTFYGLPFWHFSPGRHRARVHAARDDAPTRSPARRARRQLPERRRATTQSQFGLYRPILPITSQEVTSARCPARGLWIKALSTDDGTRNVAPKIGMPDDRPRGARAEAERPADLLPGEPVHARALDRVRQGARLRQRERPVPADAHSDRAAAGSGTSTRATVRDLLLEHARPDRAADLAGQRLVRRRRTQRIQARVTDDSGHGRRGRGARQRRRCRGLSSSSHRRRRIRRFGPARSASPTIPRSSSRRPTARTSRTARTRARTSPRRTAAPPSGPQILIQAPAGPYGLNQSVQRDVPVHRQRLAAAHRPMRRNRPERGTRSTRRASARTHSS